MVGTVKVCCEVALDLTKPFNILLDFELFILLGIAWLYSLIWFCISFSAMLDSNFNALWSSSMVDRSRVVCIA